VVEQARQSRRAEAVVVATDDRRIFAAVEEFGGKVVMTSEAHPSGTDRIAEVIRRPEFSSVNIVVNVQGDEPDIDPEIIDRLLEAVQRSPETAMATVSAPIANARDVENPNVVKVVTDQTGHALYFSRSTIPFDRDRAPGAPLITASYRKHLGIYAYRREALLKLSATPVCELERLEKLEQLRALYLGMKIFVHQAPRAPHGVDTPEDYAAFVERYNQSRQEAQPNREVQETHR
jgi:3-deoxy-manno-octulosonate cytidylyltransferase (CMP-KDO synthetase)